MKISNQWWVLARVCAWMITPLIGLYSIPSFFRIVGFNENEKPGLFPVLTAILLVLSPILGYFAFKKHHVIHNSSTPIKSRLVAFARWTTGGFATAAVTSFLSLWPIALIFSALNSNMVSDITPFLFWLSVISLILMFLTNYFLKCEKCGKRCISVVPVDDYTACVCRCCKSVYTL